MNTKWTQKEKDFIRDNANKYTDKEISLMLGKSRDATRKCRQRLGIKKKPGRGISQLDR